MSFEARLQELALTLPAPPDPGGLYVPAKTVGNLVYLSGIISRDPDGTLITGAAGLDRTAEDASHAARCCALTALAVLRKHLGSLDRVRSIVSLTGYIRATPEFGAQVAAMNGASQLLLDVFGEAGRHTRTSIGTNALPRQVLVEIQLIAECAAEA